MLDLALASTRRNAIRDPTTDSKAELYRALRRVGKLEEWPAELGRPTGPIRHLDSDPLDLFGTLLGEVIKAFRHPIPWIITPLVRSRSEMQNLGPHPGVELLWCVASAAHIARQYGMECWKLTNELHRRIGVRNPQGEGPCLRELSTLEDPHPWVTKLREDWEKAERAKCVCEELRQKEQRGFERHGSEWPAIPTSLFQNFMERRCPAKRHKPIAVDVPHNISATLTETVSATDMRFPVDASLPPPSGTAPYIRIGDEIMRVHVSTNMLIVLERGLYGTTAAPHPAGSTIHVLREYSDRGSPADIWRDLLNSADGTSDIGEYHQNHQNAPPYPLGPPTD